MIIKPSRTFEGAALPGAMSDADSLTAFTEYADSLDWGSGHRDESAWKAFLRAGSLGIEPDAAVEVVMTSIKGTGGTFTPLKLKSQVRRAYAHVGTPGDATNAIVRPSQAVFAPEKLKALAAKVAGIDAGWLAQQSPVSPVGVTSGQFLDHLYLPGEKIVVFTTFESQGQFLYTVGAIENSPPAGGSDGVWFLVNPVDGEYHPNPRQENKQSRRSEESVTDWRYMVLESDEADANDWLACLVQLPLRIAAIYTSGGKSIHALVRIDAESKPQWDQERDAIKPVVVTLGADAGAMTAVRLSRLPGTMRGEKPQQILYLNPTPDGSPIISKVATVTLTAK